MEETDLRITIVGLGIEAVAIAVLQFYDKPPIWLPALILFVGFAVIVYGLSPFPITGLRRLLLYFPQTPNLSTTREQGITLSARLRWSDSVGRPLVMIADGHMRHIWAALDIEVRNHARHKQRITELYLEIRHDSLWKLRGLIAEASPVAVDLQKHYDRPFPRRVEWELEPVSAPSSHHVKFERNWEDSEEAPFDPQTFTAAIVAELGTSSIPVRLLLGQDVWRTGEVPKQHNDEGAEETHAHAPEGQ